MKQKKEENINKTLENQMKARITGSYKFIGII